MLTALRFLLLFAPLMTAAVSGQTTTPTVGGNSPSEFIQWRFQVAYFRNQFYTLTAPAPVADVQKIGTTGLYQLFQDVAKTANTRLALMKADLNQSYIVAPDGTVTGGDVYQVLPAMWSYVASANGTSVTAPGNLNTTGYPTMDTAQCEPLAGTTCLYQTFDKKYALFAYGKPLGVVQGQNITVRDPFYTVWLSGGGLSGLGSPTWPETAATSLVSASSAVWQQFHYGAIVNITSGLLAGRQVTVKEPVYSLYAATGGPLSYLGLPVAEARVQTNGRFRQTFEGGTVEYAAGSEPVLLLPVAELQFVGAGSAVRLKQGETATLRVRLFSPTGNELTDRAVAWTTSNGRVAVVEPNGTSATIRAVGGGTALITAVSEGKASSALPVYVAADCCQPGEGSPTPAVAQAIVDTLHRNRLQVAVPVSGPVRRLGPGYVQDFTDAATGVPYLIAVPQTLATGFLVRGEILAYYLQAGGPAGGLGYPSMDATTGGRQNFSSRTALAGNPVRVVQDAIFDKWSMLGFENGAAGAPTGGTGAFSTFTASVGVAQPFQRGVIYAATAGSLTGRAFFVSGALLAAYVSLNGPGGDLGMPMADELGLDGRRRQEYEGGWLELPAGELEVQVEWKKRQPQVTATPAVVTAGGRVRLAAGGFNAGSQLRVSVTGQPDFVVTAQQGSFAWEVAVPVSAASTMVRVKADAGGGVIGEGSYRVRSMVEAEPRLVKVSGDSQTGAPGALLPERLTVVLRDSAGNPVPGVAVTFQASPGAAMQAADAVTDMRGEASASLRLPGNDSIALATASAARQVVTFQARSAALALANFPKLSQNVPGLLGNGKATIAESGGLLASVANLLRFHQDRGDLPAPNGPADVAGLNSYLKNQCLPLAGGGESLCDGFLSQDGSDEQIVNLWRISGFVGGAADFEAGEPSLETVRDWLSAGSPVLVALRLATGGVAVGMHYVVATGVAGNGGIPAYDPGGYFGRNSVNDLVGDFEAAGRVWNGTLISVLRIVPGAKGVAGFFLRADAPYQIDGTLGACRTMLPWLDRPAARSSRVEARPFVMAGCDESSSQYQMTMPDGGARIQLTTLAAPAITRTLVQEGPGALQIAGGPEWTLAPQTLQLSTEAPPVNAANGGPDLAPGTLLTLNGRGFLIPERDLSAEVDGQAAPIVQTGAFRINLALPVTLNPGAQVVKLQNGREELEVPLELSAVAPAIFYEADAGAVVLNEDGQRNSPQRPARRGRPILIHATGLGAMGMSGPIEPVIVRIGEQEARATVTALPELAGVYLLRVTVPVETAPGLAVQLAVRQGQVWSNTVSLALE
ncbi:MAG: Ig-like domain-containing protein [Bryobacterales bacterium]|nr:Ig-like domain-containing protein [Bryobacterales bacterium]